MEEVVEVVEVAVDAVARKAVKNQAPEARNFCEPGGP